jgi:GxxExxY protein
MSTQPQRAQSRTEDLEVNSFAVIGAAMRVHSAFGPGLLESAYEACVCHDWSRLDFQFNDD